MFFYDRMLASYVSEPLIEYMEGKAGSVFAWDPWALHAGNLKIFSPRLVTQIRFSSLPAQSYYIARSYLFKDKFNEINQDQFLL